MAHNFLNPSKSSVAVFSRPSALSLELVKQILENTCSVVLVSNESRKWRRFVSDFKDKNLIKFLKSTQTERMVCNYVVAIEFCQGDGNKTMSLRRTKTNIDRVIKVSKDNFAKTLFVSPYVQENVSRQSILSYLKTTIKKEDVFAAVVYVGHVLGEDASFYKDNLLTRILKKAVDFNRLDFPKKEVLFYPVSAKVVSRRLIKNLFSFGTFGLETAFITKPLSSKTLCKYLTTLRPKLNIRCFSQTPKHTAPIISSVDNVIRLHGNFETIVGGYFNNLLKSKDRKSKFRAARTIGVKMGRFSIGKKNKSRSGKSTRLSKLIILSIATFVFPFFLVMISLFSLVFGANNLKNGNFSIANNALLVSGWAGNTANIFFGVFEKIPAIGFPFSDIKRTTQILVKIAQIGESGVVLASQSSELIDKVTGDELYDLTGYSNRISLELDYIYKELGFLQNEMVSLKIGLSLLEAGGIKGSDISKLREKIYCAKKLTNELPKLLGKEGESIYLVLLQNNMELRPTGGFIGSFALVKFSEGKLVDIDVQDVYSADGQLKGHVEPPFPIKSYLGEANWFLRDSNWDPDFPTSARQAQWFLDKEIDEQVDGVVGIDLELAKDLLVITGPLVLSDFGREITRDNLYEITQAEVEENFSPGSHKKANFLTALAKEMLERVINLSSKQQVSAVKTFFENLEERHIQIFFSNANAQKAISSLGWSGEVAISTSKDNLFADWMGMVEANVGVNKQNYYVKRSAKMEIDLNEKEIVRKLSVVIENGSQVFDKGENRYKAYLRVLVPAGNIFGPVEISRDSERQLVEAEVNYVRNHMEAGVLVEVLPNQKKQIQFTWVTNMPLDFEESGAYLMFWRKQAGTLNDPILVNYNFPRGLAVESSPPFSLTGPDIFGYNTELSRDFVSQIYW